MSPSKYNESISEAMKEWRQHGHAGDNKHDVHRALAALPLVNRKIMILRFFEGFTFKECAESMNITIPKAKSLYRQSALAMKKALSREHVDMKHA